MKRHLLIATLLVMALSMMAQGHVTGTVIENDTQEPVAQTTVRLLRTDSTLATGGLTGLDGKFKIKAPKSGNYIVQITCVGFKPFTKRVKVNAEKDLALGTVTLKPDAIMLKGATVTGQATKVTLKEDTFIYNAAAYRTPEGSAIEELVKRLPGAQVDDDGKITINGKEVKKIMVDGKEFMTGDTKTAMKNLPTSIVERVRAYDQKSDLARVSGIDDGEEETVLDFGIKTGMNKGIMVNADLAAGTKDRYSGRIFGAVMKEDLKTFLMTNANNVNDMGFGMGGGGRFGGGRQGLSASKMAGANINYEKSGLLKLDAGIRWNHNDGDALVRTASENFMSGTASTFSNSLRSNFSRSNSWNAQMRLEWTPDTLWNIMFRPNFSYNSNDGLSSGNSATFSADPYAISGIINPLTQLTELIADSIVKNSNHTNSLSYSDTKTIGGSLQINRRLSSTGRNITVRFGGNYSEGTSKSIDNNTVNYYQLVDTITGLPIDSMYQTNRYSLTPTKNWDYSIRATYSEPIARQTYLQFSYQYQYRYTKSDRGTYDFSNLGLPFYTVQLRYRGWDDYLALLGNTPYEIYKDDDLSRFSEYKNYIHTAQVMLRVVRQSFNFNIGVQVIPQKSHFTQDYLGIHSDTTRTVTNFSPTADFRWKISKVSQLRLTYRGNSGQPSMSDLLDIEDNTNPLSIRKGNPGLKPSFTQSFRLRFNDYFEKRKASIMANVNFSTTSNSVSNMVTYVEETGGTITRPENINGNWNASAMLMYNTSLDSIGRFNINTFTNLSYNNAVGYVSVSRDANSEKSVTRTTVIGERLAGSYRNDWIEFELNGSLNYQHARSELQTNNNLDTWTFSYGASVMLTAPWGTQLATGLNMNSRRGFNDAAMNTNELIWNAQLSQSFLRGNALTLSLQMYDILHRQSTFSRAISAMSRTDTEYNAITNYAMLHVIYKLNIFGGFSNMGGPGGRGGRGGGFGGGRGGRGGGFGGGGFGGGGFGGGRRF